MRAGPRRGGTGSAQPKVKRIGMIPFSDGILYYGLREEHISYETPCAPPAERPSNDNS